MLEYDYFDGDHFITFYLIEVDERNNEITLVISEQGKITQVTFELKEKNGWRYFEFGIYADKIYLDEFEEAA